LPVSVLVQIVYRIVSYRMTATCSLGY